MDWKRFDRARRTVGPEELDLVESYAEGASTAVTSCVVARSSACRCRSSAPSSPPAAVTTTTTSTDDRRGRPAAPARRPAPSRRAPAGRRPPGGTIRVAAQKPAGPLDPIAMQDLGTYGIVAQCFEFLVHARRRAATSRPGSPSRGSRTTTAASGRSTCARASSGTTAPTSRRPTSPPRWTASSAAGNAGLKGVIEPGLGRRHRSRHRRRHAARRRTATSRTSCRSTTPSRSSRRSRTTTGTTLDALAERHRPVEADELRRRHRRRVRAQRRLVGRRDAARRQRVELLRRRGLDGDGRRRPARSTRSSSSRSSAATRCSTTPTSTSSASRPPPTARSGCAATPGQFADKRVRQALGDAASTARRSIDTLFKGQADIGNDHVIAPIYPFFDASVPQRDARHRRRQGSCSPRPASPTA